ncbi:PREDICTED: TIR domain-containing adapter molecule 2 [Gekko japonicus]|uniref:TIR domain-containing adapter molecule 2 n=1 Tax=Gekko japonicus TaxID=146911 RepID=A0ABM1KDK2_GEKJA|nr:PREDICTED: TIR domain-containing adapter molecule 2 [Gekko japonicus]XP_015271789.1 PREDICTED: TIR domain-containing adapter molecule 2 [Gekko japonicus]
MGSSNSKIKFPFSPRNSVKDHYRSVEQKVFNQNSALGDLSLDTDTNSHTDTPETYSSDEDTGGIFYRFVILHAEDDIDEAVRVQELLQNEFCIKPGIIFAEMPSGRHLLENLQDAMNGSAWTIILLTENFLSEHCCEFQAYACLFSSLTKPHKSNTVIPLRPRNTSLPLERTPLVLGALNALQEDSPGFAVQVKKIFQESSYRQQQAVWKNKKKEDVQELLEW